MKNIKYFIAAMFFIASFTMTWFSCEETDELAPTYTSEELTIPDEATAYLNTAEIDEMYSNVREEAEFTAGWKLQPLTIKVRTNLTYTAGLKTTSHVLLTGTGVWEEMGNVAYYENVDLKNPDDESWKGEGTITIYNKPILPMENQLAFLSGFRTEVRVPVVNTPVKPIRPIHKVFKSKVVFTGGVGIFKEAYGEAYKMETYYYDVANYCDTYIYGFVKMKKESTEAVFENK